MKELRPNSEAEARLDSDPRWLLVGRIAQSEAFRRSPRLKGFLTYVAHQRLLHPDEELNEYQVGVDVFGRPPDFNPAEESIVRSSARVLRQKLHEYYEGEGRGEPMLLDIPKGGYAPQFGTRAAQPASAPRRVWNWKRLTLVLAVCCAVLAGGVAVLWRRPSVRPRPAVPRNLAFSVFKPGDQPIAVVLCDSALVISNLVRSDPLSLDAYVRREEQGSVHLNPRGEAGSRARPFPDARLITSFRDAVFAEELAEQGLLGGYRFHLRHSRMMQARDFRTGDFVLLGSGSSNPWVSLFEDQMNFRIAMNSATRDFGVRNMNPRPGEQPVYRVTSGQGGNGVSYALITMTPNLSGRGRALLVAGILAESTEGAGEAVLSESFLREAEQAAGTRRLDALRSFELLIEVACVDGTVRGRKLLASRFAQ